MILQIDLAENERDRVTSELDAILKHPGLNAETRDAIHKVWLALAGKPHPRVIADGASQRRRRLIYLPKDEWVEHRDVPIRALFGGVR